MRACSESRPPSTRPLTLWVADSFLRRLLGVHARGFPQENEGLLITPCSAVHTFFLSQPLDVVFLDAKGNECRCVRALAPNKVARAAGARMAVELPAGYCDRHGDYLARIHLAMSRSRLPQRP